MAAPITRRAILGAAAATGAGVLPALAVAGPALQAADPDAALFALLDLYPSALAEADAAEAISNRLWDAYQKQEPPRPLALHWRHDDHFRGVSAVREMLPNGRWTLLYDTRAVHDLREAPPPVVTEHGPTLSAPDKRSVARRAEILAAHDAWWAQCDTIKVRLGLPAADAAELAAVDRLDAITAAILATPPHTLAGLGRKARLVAESGVADPALARWSAQVLADAMALAGLNSAPP